jgi:hypothetical protein
MGSTNEELFSSNDGTNSLNSTGEVFNPISFNQIPPVISERVVSPIASSPIRFDDVLYIYKGVPTMLIKRPNANVNLQDVKKQRN